MQTGMQLIAAAMLTLAAAIAVKAAAIDNPSAKKSPQPAKNSLDDELLKSLGGDAVGEQEGSLAKPAPAAATEKSTVTPATKPADDEKPAAKGAEKSAAKPANPLDEELLRSLGGSDIGSAGEDIGQNQFTKIVGQMRSVQKQLSNGNSDASTRRQQKEIAAELAALLDQLQKQAAQCQAGSCNKPGSGSKPGQGGQQPGKSPATTASNQLVKNSTTDVRPNRTDRPDPSDTQALVKKALDGLSLPDKDREQMLQAPPDEFLPNFAGSIKKYFERIVEEEGEK